MELKIEEIRSKEIKRGETVKPVRSINLSGRSRIYVRIGHDMFMMHASIKLYANYGLEDTKALTEALLNNDYKLILSDKENG